MKTFFLCCALSGSSVALAAVDVGSTIDRPMFEIAPKVGFFKNTAPLAGALYAGLEVGYVLPVLRRHLSLVLEGNWSNPRLNGAVYDPQLGSDGGYTEFSRQVGILLSAVYRVSHPIPRLTPYAGAGPGFFITRNTTTAFGTTTIESEGRWGFQALAGAEYSIGPGLAFAELHYHFTRIDFITTGTVNLTGFLAAGVGYRFRF